MRKRTLTLLLLLLVPSLLVLAFFAMPYKWNPQDFIGKSVKDLHPDAEKTDYLPGKQLFVFQSGNTLRYSGMLTIRDVDTAPVVQGAMVTNRLIGGDTTLLSKRKAVFSGEVSTIYVVWPILEFSVP